MECVSSISLGPSPGTSGGKSAVFFCPETRRCEDGNATYWGRTSGLAVLDIVFVKTSTLGRFACLLFSVSHRV